MALQSRSYAASKKVSSVQKFKAHIDDWPVLPHASGCLLTTVEGGIFRAPGFIAGAIISG
jgi:hypothetical protein